MHLVRKMTHLNVLKLQDSVGSSSELVGNITALQVWMCGFDSHLCHFLSSLFSLK